MRNTLKTPALKTKKESFITPKEFLEKVQPDEKAEYIDGEMIMHSPAMSYHSVVRRNIEFYIHEHVSYLNKGTVESEKAMIRLGNNFFEPDIIYWNETIIIDKKMMIHPIPDFVVEILSPSTENRDRNIKKKAYEEYNISEYWIVDTEEEFIEQYIINPITKKYFLHKLYKKKDTIKSTVIEDLVIPLKAIFTYTMHTGDYQLITRKRIKHSLKKEKDKRIKAEQEKIKAEQEKIKAEQEKIEQQNRAEKAETTAEQEKQERIKAEQEKIEQQNRAEKAETTAEQEKQERIKAEQEKIEQQNRAEKAEQEIAKLKAELNTLKNK